MLKWGKCPKDSDEDYDPESSIDSEGVDWYCYSCGYNDCCVNGRPRLDNSLDDKS